MPRLVHSNPAYRRHRASGQAVVTINGRDHYLGPHGTRASHAEYDRLIGEWLANGRRSPEPAVSDVTVTELIAAYWKHAEKYFAQPAGASGGELKSIRIALKVLRRLYGRTEAAAFGPIALKTVREAMIDLDWCRSYVNGQVGRVKRAFKWAVENEIVTPTVYHGLQAVAGLRVGKTSARESDPVKPVPDHVIEATLPYLSRHIRAMVELQLVSGMRPGEVCMMRVRDIDTTGKLWAYKPQTHKTSHHGHERVIYLGQRAQAIVSPFLKPDLAAYLFSPAEAEAERRQRVHERRKTPMSCGNVPGSNRTRKPAKVPGERYDVSSYRRAIARAADLADASAHGGQVIGDDERIITRWHPHQLRHNAATRLRKDYGLEAAQVILGHRTLSVTEVYAEKNVAAAQRIMSEVG